MDKKTMIALVAAAVMGFSSTAFATPHHQDPEIDVDHVAAAQKGGNAAGDDLYQTEVDIDAAAAQNGGVAAGDDATSIEVEKKDVDIASNNTTEIDVDKDVDVEKNMLSNNDTDVDVEKNMLSNNDTDVDTDFMSNNDWDYDASTNVDVKFDDLSLGLAFASKGSIALAAGGDMDVNAAIAENESRQKNDFSGLDNITVNNGAEEKVITETETIERRCRPDVVTTTETVIPGSSMAAVTARQSDVNIGSGIGMNINGAFVQATNSASALAINGNSNLTSGNQ